MVFIRHFSIPKCQTPFKEPVNDYLVIYHALASVVVSWPHEEEQAPDAVGVVLKLLIGQHHKAYIKHS